MLLAIVLPAFLYGQKQPLPTAQEVLDHYAKALGGKDAMVKHTSMTVSGTMELPERGLTLGRTEYYKGGKRLEKLTLKDGRQQLSGFDGKIGWVLNTKGEASLQEGNEALSLARDADMFYPALVLEYFRTMEVVDVTEFQGHTCYHLRGTNNWGKLNEQFYDQDTGLLVGYRFNSQWRGGSGDTIMTFSDYKNFGGWLMPTHSVYKDADGTVIQNTTSVTFDDVDDSVLVPPAAVQNLISGKTKGDKGN